MDPRAGAEPAAGPRRGADRGPGAPGFDGPPRPERPPNPPEAASPEPGTQPPPQPTRPPAGSGPRHGAAAVDRPAGGPADGTPSDEPGSRPGRWERGPLPGPGTDVGPPGREAPPSEPTSWEPTPWEPTPWEPPSWELPPSGPAPDAPSAQPSSAPAPAAPRALPPGPRPPGFTAQEPGQQPGPDASRDIRGGTAAAPPADRVPASRPPSDAPPKPASAPAGPTSGGPAGPMSGGPAGSPGSAPAVPPVPRGAVPPVPPGPVPPVPPAEALPSTTGGFRTPPSAAVPEEPSADGPRESVLSVVEPPPPAGHVGSGPPTYHPEPTALPSVEPDELGDLVADTVLDGARYGTSTLRAASVRGDSARYRGEPRRDALLTARFGTGEGALVLVAMATGARATSGAHRAAAEACRWIGEAVGRSHERLSDDIRAARRGELKSGLHRLTDRSLGKLRASAAEQGVEPEEYTAGLRCLLLPADPQCRTRVFFGVGAGGLFRLRDGEWQDIEPRVADTIGEAVVGFGSPPHETPEGDRLTMDLGITTPPSPYEPAPRPSHAPFRFRASVARPGDTLLLCTGGLAEPLRGEPELSDYLTTRWSAEEPPGLATFLADASVRVKGYADDRTAAAVWEA
uniref:protein phosphatase 2C domain-containing protein n=1 Tax=Streptomyces sp. f51 TaxID=1827742 RepID=UPI0040401FF9